MFFFRTGFSKPIMFTSLVIYAWPSSNGNGTWGAKQVRSSLSSLLRIPATQTYFGILGRPGRPILTDGVAPARFRGQDTTIPSAGPPPPFGPAAGAGVERAAEALLQTRDPLGGAPRFPVTQTYFGILGRSGRPLFTEGVVPARKFARVTGIRQHATMRRRAS